MHWLTELQNTQAGFQLSIKRFHKGKIHVLKLITFKWTTELPEGLILEYKRCYEAKVKHNFYCRNSTPLIHYYSWTARVGEMLFFLTSPWMLFLTSAVVVTTYIIIIGGIISSQSLISLPMLKLEGGSRIFWYIKHNWHQYYLMINVQYLCNRKTYESRHSLEYLG